MPLNCYPLWDLNLRLLKIQNPEQEDLLQRGFGVKINLRSGKMFNYLSKDLH